LLAPSVRKIAPQPRWPDQPIVMNFPAIKDY